MAEQLLPLDWTPASFAELPKRLQDKILPPRSISIEERERWARMNASIYPVKYRPGATVRDCDGQERACAGAPAPVTNRGGKSDRYYNGQKIPSWEAREKLDVFALGKKGKFEIVRTPKADKHFTGNLSFVDWVNFTFKTAALPVSLNTGHQALTDYEYVQGLSAHLYDVFGYGVTGQRPSGMNFYKQSFDLGEHGWGLVCIGGQNDTCSVTVKGQGLMAAQAGWEKRLFDFLNSIPHAKLTRIDLASDNFDSAVSLDDYLAMYHAGLFVNRGRAPNVEQAGNWIKPNGKGRTLYVGNRTSGKLLRIYEKGLQLANGFHEKYPNWVRVELELKNDDRVIPLDALLRPGQYLAGAYPALARLHQVQERIETFKKTADSTIERTLEVTRHQFGKHIWSLVEWFGLETAINKLTEGKDDLPKTLASVLNFQVDRDGTEYIHTDLILTFPEAELLA